MNRAWMILGLLAGCADAPAAPERDVGGGWNLTQDASSSDSSGPTFHFSLGGRALPYEPWHENDEVVAVQGIQGGFHTEHSAQVIGATPTELHLAVVWAEVWRDDLVLARAGWEFWSEQWEADDDGLHVELPVLIFDAEPVPGAAEIRGLIELEDLRSQQFNVSVEIVRSVEGP